MVKLIRQIPGRNFDTKLKVWNVPKGSSTELKQIAEIVSRFQRVSWVKEKEIDPTSNQFYIPPMPELTVPHGLNFEPKPYQATGIARGLELKRFMNADDPGLGKTYQTIGTLHIANAFPCLVICPGSVKIHWQREWMKFANRKALVLSNEVRDSWEFYVKSNLYDIIIVNFESLKKYFVRGIRTQRGKQFGFNDIVFKNSIDLFKSVVIDESQRVKDISSQQTKFALGIANGIAERKEFKIELTGTPILNNHTDLTSQLRIMDRLNDFGGVRAFNKQYCAGPNKASNGRELRAKLWQTCFFRRTKAEVKKDLPPVSRQLMTCEITNRKEYELAEKDLVSYLKMYKSLDKKKQKSMRGLAFQKMNVLAQISAKGKIKPIIEHIKDFQTSGKKLLIFCSLHSIVDALMKAFPRAVCITGRQDSNEKQRAIDAFSHNYKATLAICSIGAAGTGTDGLQHQCSEIDFIEYPWHDAGCQQCESRLDRTGQKEPVTARYWQGENTVDEKKWKIIQLKKKIADAIMGTGEEAEDENIVDMVADMFMEDEQ